MAITPSNIKLLESEVMADTTDGGGRSTSRVIPDGVAGNIFPKVSRLDSVYGRVNLRKVFGAVQTSNKDSYAGAHTIITDAPDNDRIHCTLFSTASEFDTRTAARDRIESFVTSGPESRMVLLGRQLAGQQSVVAYQRVEEPLPEVGDVYCLSTESGGTVTAQQYFRVQSVESEVRTFAESSGNGAIEFKRRVLTIGTGVALRYDFSGPETASQLSGVARPTRIRSTTFVDAARYFGIKALTEPAATNDLTVKVDSVYSPIVPTTNRETALSNIALGGAGNLVAIKASTRTETLVVSGGWTAGTTRRTLRGIKPGTLSISGAGVTSTTDDKLGTIEHETFSATVDYQTGVITRTGGTAAASSYTATYQPAVADSQIAHSREIKISIGNRGTVYALTLNPLPAPGSLIVYYRALDKWYRLRDLGDGSLAGDDPAYGVGSLDYTSGALVMTLGALPDLETSIVLSYGSPVHYVIRAGGTSDASGEIEQTFTLPDLPASPNSVSVAYTSGGVEYTGTDNSSGQISGGGITGTVNYTTGQVTIKYGTRLPDALSSVVTDYEQVVATTPGENAVQSVTVASGASMSVASTVETSSLSGNVKFGGKSVYVKDNGSGLLVAPGNQALGDVQISGGGKLSLAVVDGDQVVGTINYTTGDIVINTEINVKGSVYIPTTYVLGAAAGSAATAAGDGTWEVAHGTIAVSSGPANLGFRTGGITTTLESKSASVQFADAPLRFPVRTTVADNIVPDSLLLSIGGKTYIDRNGTLYSDVSPTTGAGTVAGEVDYDTGRIAISYWSDGAAPSLAVECCLSIYGEYTAAEVFLRTGGAPLRPGSFYVQASTLDGDLLSATADNSGYIAGTKVQGVVDQTTGVVFVRFGQMVTAAGNEAAWWYDAANVSGGMIWKPELVIPSTIRYNAVVLSNLPLNADILGLDPVRLPTDGRVPIYRPADVAVIHNTQGTTLPNPVTPGNTYSAGRTALAAIWVEDQAGTKLTAGSQYAYDLDAGTVTIAADFSIGDLVAPLVIKHRIEDMVLISDVQINGQLEFSPALSRDYPADTSFVSSAILFGDMNARVTNVFDLLTFSAWSDTPGTQATAQYNNIDYPIEVLNNGAVTERWRINFTTATAFQVIGENLGVIATGTTGADCSPTNQLTGLPYFVIRAAGWGSGWSAGNNLRFNTVSAAAPIWIARTVLPGATLDGDSFSLQMRGDVDA